MVKSAPPMVPRPAYKTHIHGNPILRWVLVGFGFAFLALGLVGVFVPLLPTTPFVLVAGACFVRGSRRLNIWLLRTRFFGPIIRQWRTHRTIPLRAKRVAQALIVLSFGSSAGFFVSLPWARVVVAVLGLIALLLVSRIPARINPA